MSTGTGDGEVEPVIIMNVESILDGFVSIELADFCSASGISVFGSSKKIRLKSSQKNVDNVTQT